jgi:hypothetical protein
MKNYCQRNQAFMAARTSLGGGSVKCRPSKRELKLTDKSFIVYSMDDRGECYKFWSQTVIAIPTWSALKLPGPWVW